MKSKVGLIGMPVAHSLSPFIHQEMHDLDYSLFETLAIEDVFNSADLTGLNVTAPLKDKAFEMADVLDLLALKTRAVNTLIKKNQEVHGFNTDVSALMDIFKAHIKVDMQTPVTVIGNGATSRSVNVALERLGFKNVQTYARHPKKGEYDLKEALIAPEVLIQTTPLGMHHLGDDFPLQQFDFKKTSFIFDVVYAPLYTPLIQEAKRLKIPHLNGVSMLVRQAHHAAQLFLNQPLDSSLISTIEKKIYQRHENIVLIGMPYSGKSSLGEALASSLNKPFIDTDKKIEEKLGVPVKEFLVNHGEKAFRVLEKEVISSLKNHQGCVVATGGGSLLDPDNISVLKRYGWMVFLDAPTPKTFHDSRPLSKDLETYLKLKKERGPIYLSASDFTLKGYLEIKSYVKEITTQYEKHLNSKRS